MPTSVNVGLHYVEAGDTVKWVRRALANWVQSALRACEVDRQVMTTSRESRRQHRRRAHGRGRDALCDTHGGNEGPAKARCRLLLFVRGDRVLARTRRLLLGGRARLNSAA